MRMLLVGLLGLAATPALAQDRELCSDRPGLGTPPCVVQPGKVQIETGLIDWTRSDDSSARTDTILLADSLARIGVTDTVELQLGWTPYGHQRMRDRTSGTIDRAGRVGDALVGAKANFISPDGSDFSLATQVQVTLPVGREPIGTGDWGVSVLLPVSYELPHGFSLQATPELDAAVDSDGRGRHVTWGSTVGLGFDLSEKVTAAIEAQALRDDDPGGRTTQAFAGLSLAWQPSKTLQLDTGVNAGLNRDSDDVEVYAGFTKRF